MHDRDNGIGRGRTAARRRAGNGAIYRQRLHGHRPHQVRVYRKVRRRGREWASWSCKGYAGTPVRVFEGDLRFSVSYGSAAEKQCAAGQTFGAFNRLGPTIEWRLEDGKPFATILRWHTETEDERGSWLVVTRLSGAEACHMGYVDAALPGANTLARRLADLMARSFDCNADVPEVVARKKVDLAQLVSGDCGNK